LLAGRKSNGPFRALAAKITTFAFSRKQRGQQADGGRPSRVSCLARNVGRPVAPASAGRRRRRRRSSSSSLLAAPRSIRRPTKRRASLGAPAPRVGGAGRPAKGFVSARGLADERRSAANIRLQAGQSIRAAEWPAPVVWPASLIELSSLVR